MTLLSHLTPRIFLSSRQGAAKQGVISIPELGSDMHTRTTEPRTTSDAPKSLPAFIYDLPIEDFVMPDTPYTCGTLMDTHISFMSPHHTFYTSSPSFATFVSLMIALTYAMR
jgi:hypothetical protein